MMYVDLIVYNHYEFNPKLLISDIIFTKKLNTLSIQCNELLYQQNNDVVCFKAANSIMFLSILIHSTIYNEWILQIIEHQLHVLWKKKPSILFPILHCWLFAMTDVNLMLQPHLNIVDFGLL